MRGRPDRIEDLESRLEEALATVRDLRAENERLRARPDVGPSEPRTTLDPTTPSHVATAGIDTHSPESAKIALFRGLFRGRDDVYAYRWEGRDGRSGYSPALRPGADRQKGRRPDPSALLPLDDEVVKSHLLGQRVIGVYPLLEDETCRFLAIDFDKSSWQDDAREVLKACDDLGVPAVLERSRSGRGGHIWIFFDGAVAAATARNLGCVLLTSALERRHQIGFGSYDRLFPCQDTIPTGGFGNLIALPLQRVARRSDNTVFLDRDLRPYPDQWRYLASLRRLPAAECERIVRDAARAGTILGIDASWFETEEDAHEPWRLRPSRRWPETPIRGPLPSAIEVVVANRIFIPKTDLPPLLIGRLRRLAAFQNPEFYRAQAMRLWTGDKPRVIDCSEDFPEHLALPRGLLGVVVDLFERHKIQVELHDERQVGVPVALRFHGTLGAAQREAAEAMAAHDIGILAAPTAFGKTVIAAWLIAERGVNTLVVVHRQQLADQWRERLATFLDVEPRSIGQFGAGRNKGTVDCDNEAEQATGLFTMLEDNLVVPFETSVLGVTVTVERIDLDAGDRIVAICRRGRVRQAIPLLDLPLPMRAPEGAEWIAAYRHWSGGE